MISRWYHYTGKITDIINDGRQVKKIHNLIFEKLFEPTDTLIEEWIFWVVIPVAEPIISSYKNPCDIHLKHVFLTEFDL